MKVYLLVAIFTIVSLRSTCQTQIPNGDFENWTTFSKCSELDSLDNFLSVDQSAYYEILDELNFSYCTPNPSTLKSTNEYTGTYALLMTPTPIPNSTNFTSNVVVLTTSIDLDNTGMPFTGRPTKLVGYYKFTKAGTDTVGIMLGGYSDVTSEDIFYGEFTAKTTTSAYTRFEIDLEYYSTASPTGLDLIITVSNTAGNGSDGTELLIDNLVFEYNTPTSTVNYAPTSPINVYATQNNIHFSDDVSEIHIVDMIGSEKITHGSKTNAVNTSFLNTGLYIVTYKYNEAYFSKKIVLE